VTAAIKAAAIFPLALAHPAAFLASEGVTLVVAGVILGSALGRGAAEGLGCWIARSSRGCPERPV